MNETNKIEKTTIWTRGFICILIANVCMSMASFSINTYVTTYVSYLGMGTTLTGLIAGIYYFVAFALRPVSGPLVTMLRKKQLIITVYTGSIFVNLGYALFPTIGMFVVMRFLHGVQLAFQGSLALTIASDSLPPEKMASGIGVYGLSGIVAQALGPGMAVSLINFGTRLGGEGGGFRTIFLAAAAFSAMSVIPCLMLPNKEKSDRTLLGAWYKNIIAKEAVVPSIILTLLTMSTTLFSTYLIPYGSWKNISNIGLYFTFNASVTVFARPLSGRMTDKYGANKVFYVGILVYMCAFLCISSAKDISLIILGAVCASIGNGTVQPAVQSMAMQSVSKAKRGVASNTVFLGMDLGGFLGPALAGIVLSHFDYSIMYRMAVIPLIINMFVFTLGWKPYLRQREKLEIEESRNN